MVDDHVDRHERVDFGRVGAEAGQRAAHGSEVDQAGHSGEVLQDHARGFERQLVAANVFGVPVGDAVDILLGDFKVVALTQRLFDHDFDREGQAGDLRAERGDVEIRDAAGVETAFG